MDSRIEQPPLRRQPVNLFVLHAILTLAWVLVTGTLSGLNLVIGYVLAGIALWIPRGLWGDTLYFARFRRVLSLAGTFIYELVVSAIQVLQLVYTPRLQFQSGIIAVPLDARDDLEIMVFANLISLTPGTLSMDVSDDRETLYVHSMAIEDPEADKHDLKRTFEDRIREAFE
ncbi:multicomponent Na+:H+ antiporter subunit E [Limimonas halophila]|uniref:Multicomponent Na+:H+ antiporter subunit E n=1 Tax=Limimonas halophila TaxID=1082479 RepID=A0A1G7NSX3_9PROT|nr:Na+/H+ antiporter subunit E [Limimonas halophila]SDF77033.1 multicomponent Na+:H+ antiporter subunit E [Limimonas halophila]